MAQKACKDCHKVVDEADVNEKGFCGVCVAKHAAELAASAALVS